MSILVIFSFVTLFQNHSYAGSVEGPYLIWVNLASSETQGADEKIKNFVNGEQRLCWPEGALLFMRSRPKEVTNELVHRALEKKDLAAQKQLRRLLKKPFGEVPGFDGIVAYSNQKEPTLIGLPIKGPLQAERIRSSTGVEAWGATFCHVMPTVSRRP